MPVTSEAHGAEDEGARGADPIYRREQLCRNGPIKCKSDVIQSNKFHMSSSNSGAVSMWLLKSKKILRDESR